MPVFYLVTSLIFLILNTKFNQPVRTVKPDRKKCPFGHFNNRLIN
ncbi:hypothetical protein ALT761_01158 [Alteromonas sp. 76-1]|nr:hypothetical protein ALT761_01158 [Alteromonas sp. 76-1]